MGSSGQLEGSAGQQEGSEGKLEESEGLPLSSQGQPEGTENHPLGYEKQPWVIDRQTIGQINGRTTITFPCSTELCPLLGQLLNMAKLGPKNPLVKDQNG